MPPTSGKANFQAPHPLHGGGTRRELGNTTANPCAKKARASAGKTSGASVSRRRRGNNASTPNPSRRAANTH